MKKYKVVLLGDSHLFIENGYFRGLTNKGVDVQNLSLSGSPSINIIFTILRNKQVLQEADLIIYSSNNNDANFFNGVDEELNFKFLHCLYNELYMLEKKILVLIAPMTHDFLKVETCEYVEKLHKFLIQYYGFNFINIYNYYKDLDLKEFHARYDGAHDFGFLMREISEKIVENIEKIKMPNKVKNKISFPVFKDCNARKMLNLNQNNISAKYNSRKKEEVYTICSGNFVNFTNDFYNHYIVGISFWNSDDCDRLIFKRYDEEIYEFYSDYKWLACYPIRKDILVDEKLKLQSNNFSLVSIVLATSEWLNLENLENFNNIINKDMEIDKDLDFSYLIPNVAWYKEIIDEYCSVMDPRKAQPYLDEISKLKTIINDNCFNEEDLKQAKKELEEVKSENQFLLNFGRASDRVKKHLAYKIGNAIIDSKNSFMNMILLPFTILHLYYTHKLTKDIKYEYKLEQYPDYQECLKIKKFYSYKLGELLIKCSKNYYGGGLITFPYKAYKLHKKYFKKLK
ncbi:hypothetical protein AVBRAN12654_05480 [Campylobacter sp. RM12654]|uniref:hypothetical protein n=1 Tax=Campylobacter sp. RM12654 TaxID=2735738 RepID=UPI003014DE7A|nr:hypothetical protein [Campylobacter sp. RM12654]